MLKKILIGILALVALAFIAFQIFINTGERVHLPQETDQVVQQILAGEELPELIKGRTDYAQNGDVKIWYEVMNEVDTPKATVLLVMGHSATALAWTASFYQPLLDEGYQVIRYDNRGAGESSWMKDWSPENTYTLEDMAKDVVTILDKENIEKAHIIGASMGGMIAQRLAISHSDRVASLTSFMSTGYWEDPSIAAPETFITQFTKLVLKYAFFSPSDEDMVKFRVGVRQSLKGAGDYTFDVKKSAQRAYYEMTKRKGFNPTVGDQHTAAISKSGSRLEELGNIKMPTLIIHGKSDPLVMFPHCEKYAPLIPHAEKLYIDGMGHDFPDVYMDQFHEAIFKNFTKVELEKTKTTAMQ